MTEQDIEKKKPSIRERLANFISPKTDPGYITKELKDLGVDVLKDQKLENRIWLLYEFQNEFQSEIAPENLEDYVRELRTRTQLLHEVISLIAMPYATAANYPYMQKKYSAWLTIYSSAMSLILHAEEEIRPIEDDATEEKKIMNELRQIGAMEHSMLVRFLHESLQRHYWREGFSFMNQCFRDKHVSERAAIVVQNQMGLGNTGLNKAPKTKEDKAGDEMWQDALFMQNQRLARIEEMMKKKGKA